MRRVSHHWVANPAVVELVYGVAPGWRGRGLATRAAILATTWLLAERQVTAVELRVGREHHASQRVAGKAGYRLAGTMRQQVPATGEEFEDLRYIFTAADHARRVASDANVAGGD
jgi:RimJ/RimL family protein N-acetyltransferase